ncbi:unnamed protein product [Closterium sp. Naga37s-1]|nr:unnamed protein product [Closterium sp. Naga37s-1]
MSAAFAAGTCQLTWRTVSSAASSEARESASRLARHGQGARVRCSGWKGNTWRLRSGKEASGRWNGDGKRTRVARLRAGLDDQPGPTSPMQGQTRRQLLVEYVRGVQPDFMEKFFQHAEPQLVDAMRQTVSNMLGSLPPQYFEVTVTTVGENLAQLMFSVMMTGYMFRNAQYRLELSSSFAGAVALPAASSTSSPTSPTSLPSSFPPHIPSSSSSTSSSSVQPLPASSAFTSSDRQRGSSSGSSSGSDSESGSWPPSDNALPLGPVQKTHVAGEVLRWDAEAERVVRVPAVDYVELLEGEVRALKRRLEEEEARLARVGAGGGGSGNALLEYLKRLEPQNIQELTASADDDALAAMNAFIQRLLGVPDVGEIKSVASETTVTELAKLLYWLMVVGYTIMGSSTASLRRLEKSFLPFLFLSLLLAFGMMACAPAEAARVLKANLVNPNGPTSAHNALQSPASDQFSPVPAAEHPPPVQTAVGSEPSDGSAAVTSEPSIDPLVVVSAVNGGDEEAGNEPDGADSSAAAAAPVPTSWLRPAQMPNDHGPYPLETDPLPAVGSGEEPPEGNEDGLVPEVYVALPEEAAPAEAPAGSQGVAPTPGAAESSAPAPAAVPSAWLRPALVLIDPQMPNDPQPNDHGPFLLGTDPMPAVGSEEEAPAGNEDVLVPEIYVALPEEAAPGEAPAGSQGVAPMPDGADSGGSGPVPSAWLRQAKVKGDHQVPNGDQVPNDHGPYLLGTGAAIPAVGSEEEAPAGNENELLPAVLVPQPEEAAPGEAPAGNEDVLMPEIYVALPEEAAPGEAAAAGSQGVAPMPDGADSGGSGPVPSAWLRQAKVKGDHQVANDDQVPNDHGPYLLGTDAAIPAVGSAGNEDVLVPEIDVALPEEAAPGEAPATGSQGVAPMPDGADSGGSGPVPSAWLRQAKVKGDHQVANDDQVPNDHGPYLLGTDAAIPAVGSAGNEDVLVPEIDVALPEEAAPGEAPATGSQGVAPMPDGADSGGSGPVLSAWLRQAKVKGDHQVANDDQVPNDHGPYLLGTDAAIPAVGSAGNEDVLVPEIYVALPEEAAPGEAPATGSQGVAPMPDGAESSALVPIPNDHGPYLLGVDSTVGSEQEATVGEEQALLKMPAVIVPLPEENAPGEAAAGSQVVPPEN